MNKLTVSELIDALIIRMDLKNDAKLSKLLELAPPVISKLRSGKLKLGATVIIRIHEKTGMSVKEIKSYMNQDV